MLCANDELVGKARMLIVMNEVGDERHKQVFFFVLLKFTCHDEKVICLKRIDDVNWVVKRVLIEIAFLNLVRGFY